MNIESATIADLELLAKDSRVKTISISDTADNVLKGLDTLQKYNKKIGAIIDKKFVDPSSPVEPNQPLSTLTITESQFKKDSIILNKIYKGFDLALTAKAATIATSKNAFIIANLSIIDTSSNIQKNIKALNAISTHIDEILTPDDTPINLTFTASDTSKYTNILNKFTYGWHINIKGNAKVSDVSDLVTLWINKKENNNINQFTISPYKIFDTGANINSELSSSGDAIYYAQATHVTDNVKIGQNRSGSNFSDNLAGLIYNGKFDSTTSFHFIDEDFPYTIEDFFHRQNPKPFKSIGIEISAQTSEKNSSLIDNLKKTTPNLTITIRN